MRYLILLLTLVIIWQNASGQTIDYSVPKGYEKEIGKKDYRKLIDISVSVIAKKYEIDFVKDGSILLKVGQDMKVFNVHNLIAKCSAVKDQNQWNKVIEQHFENMFAAIDTQNKLDTKDFNAVSPYLSLRVYGQEFIQQRGGSENFITKIDLDGAYTVLMLDLPGAFVPVEKLAFVDWKQNKEKVFAIAQKNVNQQTVEKITKKFNLDQVEIEITFLGNEDYAASYALDLITNSPELVGEWGSAVAIPNKGLVNVCKISRKQPLDFVKFIQLTKAAVGQYYAQHPQPISDQYFWYYKGKFTLISITTDSNGALQVLAPMGLAELMTEKK